MEKTLYDVLGVSLTATRAEIEAASLQLAQRYRPDANPGDSAAHDRFVAIERAYETLIDDGRRREYDSSLQNRRQRIPFRPALSLIALSLLAASAFSGYWYWNEQEETRLAEQRAEDAARKHLQQQALELERVRQAAISQRQQAEASGRQSSTDAPSMGTIRSQQAVELQATLDEDKRRKVKATTELHVAKLILGQVAILESLKPDVVRELRKIALLSGRYGAAGTYGLGDGMARRIERINATGCALNVRAQLIRAANRIDEMAQFWMQIDEGRITGDLSTEDYERAVELAVNECRRVATADIQYFSGIR